MTKNLFIKIAAFYSTGLYLLYNYSTALVLAIDDPRHGGGSDATGNNPFGIVKPPPGADKYGSFCTGFIPFLNNILRIFFIIAGLFAFVNLVIAGFEFMQAGGDAKQIEKAWAKIWQSFVGLLILVSSFAIAALIGIVLFKDPGAILNPVITGAPGSVCP